MGFHVAERCQEKTDLSGRSRQARTDPPSENRVWDFQNTSRFRARRFSSQPLETTSETTVTLTIIVSGLPLWPSRDPIGEIGGFNLYGAFDNSPIDTADMLGMASVVFTGNASVDLTISFKHELTKSFNVPYGAAIWYEPKKNACGFEWKKVFWIDDVYPTSGSLMKGLKPDDLLIVKAYKKYDEVKGLIDLLQAIYGGSFKKIAEKAVSWDVIGEFSGVKYELDSLKGLRGPLYHKTGADGKDQVCTKVRVKFQATVSASVKLKMTVGLKVGPKKSFTGSKGYLSNKWVTTDPKEVCVPCQCPEEDSTTKSGGNIP